MAKDLSAIDAKIDELTTKFDAYKEVVRAEFAALQAQIAAGNQISDEMIAASIAKIDAVEADIDSAPTTSDTSAGTQG